jgi:integrase
VGLRDSTIPCRLPARSTGFRADQVDFRTATLHVRRVKKGTHSMHPILGDELRALRRLQREQEPKSPFVFTSERGAPFTTAGFARMVERAGFEATFFGNLWLPQSATNEVQSRRAISYLSSHVCSALVSCLAMRLSFAREAMRG